MIEIILSLVGLPEVKIPMAVTLKNIRGEKEDIQINADRNIRCSTGTRLASAVDRLLQDRHGPIRHGGAQSMRLIFRGMRMQTAGASGDEFLSTYGIEDGATVHIVNNDSRWNDREIVVQAPSGKVCIHVSANHNVQDMKLIIERETGIPASRLKLWYKGHDISEVGGCYRHLQTMYTLSRHLESRGSDFFLGEEPESSSECIVAELLTQDEALTQSQAMQIDADIARIQLSLSLAYPEFRP